jgi:hypothetical protein
MAEVQIVTAPIDAQNELAQFDIALAVAHKIARAASAGRASALDIDVAFAPGMLSHIQGNRQIRRELLPRGWRIGRLNNVESVVNDELGIQIVFQNVDRACDDSHSPQAISGKGAGARRLVQAGLQAELFEQPALALTTSVPSTRHMSKLGVTPTVWLFCVSDDGTRLRAELSKPDNFEGNQLGKFSKRIFILDEESGDRKEAKIGPSDNDDGSVLDVDVKVVRK